MSSIVVMKLTYVDPERDRHHPGLFENVLLEGEETRAPVVPVHRHDALVDLCNDASHASPVPYEPGHVHDSGRVEDYRAEKRYPN